MLLEPIDPIMLVMREAVHRTVIRVIRSHPEWTLLQLREYAEGPGPGSTVLGSVTVHELRVCDERDRVELPPDGGPPIQHARLENAKRARGDNFDAYMREVLGEVSRPVGAAYLRARLGGPRWKLLGSLRRLVDAGVVERTGATSATLYALHRVPLTS
jgi:hypothetical protein